MGFSVLPNKPKNKNKLLKTVNASSPKIKARIESEIYKSDLLPSSSTSFNRQKR